MLLRDVQVLRADHVGLDCGEPDGLVPSFPFSAFPLPLLPVPSPFFGSPPRDADPRPAHTAESASLLEGTGLSLKVPTPNLSPLSLLYDVARPEDVTVVITEAGLIPAQSVPVLLRDFKPL